VKDKGPAPLPRSYGGLRDLQGEFETYQRAAFPEREPRFFALELCGEAGELANLEKKTWKGREVDEADFIDEAADVVIAIMNYANARNIDIAHAVSGKMAEIDRRRLREPER
jgi:NTP pyrophosphatase (non-canonical NTP hydrolase)